MSSPTLTQYYHENSARHLRLHEGLCLNLSLKGSLSSMFQDSNREDNQAILNGFQLYEDGKFGSTV